MKACARAVLTLFLACSPAAAGQFAYVVSSGAAASVEIIDTATNIVTGSIPIGTTSFGPYIAISPDGGRAYVTGTDTEIDAQTVNVIDTTTNTVIDTIYTDVVRLGRVALSPDSAFAYVTSLNPTALLAIDTATDTVAWQIPVPQDNLQGLLGIAITPDGRFAYLPPVFPKDSPVVTVVDLSRQEIVTTVPMPPCLLDSVGISTDIAITPPGTRPDGKSFAYVPVFGCEGSPGSAAGIGQCVGDCNMDGTVTVDEVLTNVQIALDDSTTTACQLVYGDGNHTVTVDELLAAINAVLEGCAPRQTSGNFSLVIDAETNKVVEIIDFGSAGPGAAAQRPRSAEVQPSGTGIDIAPDGTFAYLAGCGGGVCMIDTTTNTAGSSIDTGGLTFDVAITRNGLAYVTDIDQQRVIVIDTRTSTVTANVFLSFPAGVAILDTSTGDFNRKAKAVFPAVRDRQALVSTLRGLLSGQRLDIADSSPIRPALRECAARARQAHHDAAMVLPLAPERRLAPVR